MLTLAGAFEACCEACVEVGADSLRTCLARALFGAGLDGCVVAGMVADLLLEAVASGFAKATQFEARF